MNNNDVFRSIRLILNIDEASVVNIFNLADCSIPLATVSGYLKESREPGYVECTNEHLIFFLDGLITHRRGQSKDDQGNTKKPFSPLTNNVILKKLRIAFDLKEDDMIELMSLADYEVSKNELGSIFRKLGHKHYRECSDDFIMAFLVGLSFRQLH